MAVPLFSPLKTKSGRPKTQRGQWLTMAFIWPWLMLQRNDLTSNFRVCPPRRILYNTTRLAIKKNGMPSYNIDDWKIVHFPNHNSATFVKSMTSRFHYRKSPRKNMQIRSWLSMYKTMFSRLVHSPAQIGNRSDSVRRSPAIIVLFLSTDDERDDGPRTLRTRDVT